MPLTDVSEAAPILNECDLKLSDYMPAELNALRKTTENWYRVIAFHLDGNK